MALEITIAVNGVIDTELADARAVEVHERMGETTTFVLRYPVQIRGDDLPILSDERLSSGSELSIFAAAGGRVVCLAKGPVFGQRIHLLHGGAPSDDEYSYVEVMGADTSITMDRENKAAVWSDLTDSDAVSAIVGTYGLQPDIESSAACHMETKHTLVQRDTDLQFVRRLARRNGCLFWVTADENGLETAHFKRPALGDSSENELIINLDSANLEALDITWDIENPTSATAMQLDLNTKSSIDGGVGTVPLPTLGSIPLASITNQTRSSYLVAPVDDVGDLQARTEAALIDKSFFLRAFTRTTAQALGSVVRAHTVVRVRGAGSRHSGNYYCSGVRHVIEEGMHRMEVELLRNGWGS